VSVAANQIRTARASHFIHQGAQAQEKDLSMNSRTLALIIAFVLPCAVCAADQITPPAVPGTIAVAAGYKPFLIGHAVGTQNYICAPDLVNGGVKWLFIGPQATVFDADGIQMLTHYQSENPLEPDVIDATWQHSHDTSAVWGRKIRGSVDPAFVRPDAIEWLLLGRTATRIGPDGGDKMMAAVFIQRVNTVGGKAPAAGCDDSKVNTRKLVPYEADYIFYK
jgi:hypothetical protein